MKDPIKKSIPINVTNCSGRDEKDVKAVIARRNSFSFDQPLFPVFLSGTLKYTSVLYSPPRR